MVTQSGATVTVALAPSRVDRRTVDKEGIIEAFDATALTTAAYDDTLDEWTLVGPAATFSGDFLVEGTKVSAALDVTNDAGGLYEFVGDVKAGATATTLVLENIVVVATEPTGNIAADTVEAGEYALYFPFAAMRLTDRNGPSLEVGELTSGEVSANRQETSIRSGFQQVSGQLGFELSHISQDPLLELATADPFTVRIDATGSYYNDGATDYTAATRTFSQLNAIPAGDVGQYALCFYDGSFSFVGLIESTTSVKVVQGLKGEAPESDITNSTGSSFTIEPYSVSMVRENPMRYSTIVKDYPEISLAQAFGGCTVNNLSMSVQPGSLVTGTADILGLQAKTMVGEGNTAGRFNYGEDGGWRVTVEANASPSSTAYSPFASCVAINNVPNGIVSGFDFTINNNRETLPLLCSEFADTVYEGVANVSGTMTILFDSADEYNKFANETESSVIISLSGGQTDGSDSMFIYFPRVRYTQPSFEIPANGPVVLTLNFRSLESTYDSVPTSCVIGRA